MAFSDTLCTEARPIWEAIHRHPLDAFARTVGLLLGRARTTPDLERLSPRLVKPVEKPLHRKLFDLAGLTEEAVAEAGPFERERLREAFLTSSRYEYAFWEMAYRMETWPV